MTKKKKLIVSVMCLIIIGGNSVGIANGNYWHIGIVLMGIWFLIWTLRGIDLFKT